MSFDFAQCVRVCVFWFVLFSLFLFADDDRSVYDGDSKRICCRSTDMRHLKWNENR